MPRTTAKGPFPPVALKTRRGRRSTLVSAPPAASPELVDRPHQRRTFTAADKVRILAEIDRAGPGGAGAILRREGLYSSALTDWRRQRDAGAYEALKAVRRGPKAAPSQSPGGRARPTAARQQTPYSAAAARRGGDRYPKKSGFASGPGDRQRRDVLMDAVAATAPEAGVIAAACTAVGLSRATFHRHQMTAKRPPAPTRPRPKPAGLSQRMNVRASWTCCARRGSSIKPRPRSTPPCSTKASIVARSAPCIGSCTRTTRSGNAASSCAIPSM